MARPERSAATVQPPGPWRPSGIGLVAMARRRSCLWYRHRRGCYRRRGRRQRWRQLPGRPRRRNPDASASHHCRDSGSLSDSPARYASRAARRLRRSKRGHLLPACAPGRGVPSPSRDRRHYGAREAHSDDVPRTGRRRTRWAVSSVRRRSTGRGSRRLSHHPPRVSWRIGHGCRVSANHRRTRRSPILGGWPRLSRHGLRMRSVRDLVRSVCASAALLLHLSKRRSRFGVDHGPRSKRRQRRRHPQWTPDPHPARRWPDIHGLPAVSHQRRTHRGTSLALPCALSRTGDQRVAARRHAEGARPAQSGGHRSARTAHCGSVHPGRRACSDPCTGYLWPGPTCRRFRSGFPHRWLRRERRLRCDRARARSRRVRVLRPLPLRSGCHQNERRPAGQVHRHRGERRKGHHSPSR